MTTKSICSNEAKTAQNTTRPESPDAMLTHTTPVSGSPIPRVDTHDTSVVINSENHLMKLQPHCAISRYDNKTLGSFSQVSLSSFSYEAALMDEKSNKSPELIITEENGGLYIEEKNSTNGQTIRANTATLTFNKLAKKNNIQELKRKELRPMDVINIVGINQDTMSCKENIDEVTKNLTKSDIDLLQQTAKAVKKHQLKNKNHGVLVLSAERHDNKTQATFNQALSHALQSHPVYTEESLRPSMVHQSNYKKVIDALPSPYKKNDLPKKIADFTVGKTENLHVTKTLHPNSMLEKEAVEVIKIAANKIYAATTFNEKEPEDHPRKSIGAAIGGGLIGGKKNSDETFVIGNVNMFSNNNDEKEHQNFLKKRLGQDAVISVDLSKQGLTEIQTQVPPGDCLIAAIGATHALSHQPKDNAIKNGSYVMPLGDTKKMHLYEPKNTVAATPDYAVKDALVVVREFPTNNNNDLIDLSYMDPYYQDENGGVYAYKPVTNETYQMLKTNNFTNPENNPFNNKLDPLSNRLGRLLKKDNTNVVENMTDALASCFDEEALWGGGAPVFSKLQYMGNKETEIFCKVVNDLFTGKNFNAKFGFVPDELVNHCETHSEELKMVKEALLIGV